MEAVKNNPIPYPKVQSNTPLTNRTIKFKTQSELSQIPKTVKSKIESLPVNIPFTITETFRTKEEYENLKKRGYEVSEKYNDHSNAIDVKYDEEGHRFIAWMQNEGHSWAKQNIKEVRAHGEGKTLHYHIVFK